MDTDSLQEAGGDGVDSRGQRGPEAQEGPRGEEEEGGGYTHVHSLRTETVEHPCTHAFSEPTEPLAIWQRLPLTRLESGWTLTSVQPLACPARC